MKIISMLCPHCLTENSAIELVDSVDNVNDRNLVTTFGYCRTCYKGVCFEFFRKQRTGSRPETSDDLEENYTKIQTYPRPDKTECPSYCENNVELYYLQAAGCMRRGLYDAAGMMFRKVLDVSTKIIGADPKKKLKNRIDDLKLNNRITPELAEWAHQIRIDGNEAAHEDEPFTKESAEALYGFTELFLTYIFTLPGMLAARKAAATSSSST